MNLRFQIFQNNQNYQESSIILEVGSKRYIFNAPETFLRFQIFHQLKLSQGTIIFLTKMKTHTIAGISGLLFTLMQQNKLQDLKIYGCFPLTLFKDQLRFILGNGIFLISTFEFASKQKQIFNKSLGINSYGIIKRILKNKIINDSLTFNHYIEQNAQSINQKMINDAGKFVFYEDGHQIYQDENLKIVSLVFHDNKIKALNQQYLNNTLISYIIIPTKQRGKINLSKLDHLKIPKGKIKQIAEKGYLSLENGEVIYNHQIQDNDYPSQSFLIIQCPNFNILNQLEQNQFIQKLYENNINKNEISIKSIIHLTPDNIIKSPSYQKFMLKFEQDCFHIFNTNNIYDSSIELKQKQDFDQNYKHFQYVEDFHKMFSDHFPSLIKNNDQNNQIINDENDINFFLKQIKNKQISKNFYKFTLNPINQSGFSQISNMNINALIQNSEYEDYLQEYKQLMLEINQIKQSKKNQKYADQEPIITFLGTGSRNPQYFRNVSGILIQISNNFSALFDCGDGTLYQIKNQFGLDNYSKVIASLKFIFISHYHSDHHIGIFSIIKERKILREQQIYADILKEPLYLIIPANLFDWVSFYQKFLEDLDLKILLSQDLDEYYNNESIIVSQEKPCTQFNFLYNKDNIDIESQIKIKQNMRDFVQSLDGQNIKSFIPVKVQHCDGSYGIVFEHRSGYKIVYSGDARPNQELINHGQNADVLIHEATFGIKMQEEALKRYHSTVKEAIEVAIQMKAKRLILNHFSQRYQKSGFSFCEIDQYVSPEVRKYFLEQTLQSYDHLQTNLSQLEYLPKISQFLNKIGKNIFF